MNGALQTHRFRSDDMFRLWHNGFFFLEPLSLLEVGELYEAQGQMTDDALLHYVRRIACTAHTVCDRTNTRVTLFGCQMHCLSTLFAEC